MTASREAAPVCAAFVDDRFLGGLGSKLHLHFTLPALNLHKIWRNGSGTAEERPPRDSQMSSHPRNSVG
jgi:hypothetical protein